MSPYTGYFRSPSEFFTLSGSKMKNVQKILSVFVHSKTLFSMNKWKFSEKVLKQLKNGVDEIFNLLLIIYKKN